MPTRFARRRGARPISAIDALVIATAVLVSGVTVTRAQDEPPREGSPAASDPRTLEEARAAFAEGVDAAAAERWPDAERAFERAYELSRVGAALYNLGFAYRARGKYTAAREAFARVLRDHLELDPGQRAEAERILAEVEARIARLRLAGFAPRGDDVVRLDGAVVSPLPAPPVLETDPGSHALRVERRDHLPFEWSGRLRDGEEQTVEVELVPRPARSPSSSGERDEGSSVLSSPVFWILTGVVVAAGVGAAVYFTYDDQTVEPLATRRVDL